MNTSTGTPLHLTREVLIRLLHRYQDEKDSAACCKWLPKLPPWSADDLRRHRRPKPPSLKEQALNDLDDIPTHDDEGRQVVDLSNIRRAIEQLPD